MFKFLLILSLGIAMGYNYGWKDAHVNTKNIAQRLVDRMSDADPVSPATNADLDAKKRTAESR